jgi:hypothetical protein
LRWSEVGEEAGFFSHKLLSLPSYSFVRANTATNTQPPTQAAAHHWQSLVWRQLGKVARQGEVDVWQLRQSSSHLRGACPRMQHNWHSNGQPPQRVVHSTKGAHAVHLHTEGSRQRPGHSSLPCMHWKHGQAGSCALHPCRTAYTAAYRHWPLELLSKLQLLLKHLQLQLPVSLWRPRPPVQPTLQVAWRRHCSCR